LKVPAGYLLAVTKEGLFKPSGSLSGVLTIKTLRQVLKNSHIVPFYYLLTYLPTPWSRVLPEKLTGSEIVKKFPTFYGTRRFIVVFVRARQLSLSSATSIQSIPSHPTS